MKMDDNKHIKVGRWSENRLCGSFKCNRRFIIKKRLKHIKYCPECRKSYPDRQKESQERARDILKEFNLQNFTIRYTGNKGYGLQIKESIIRLGFSRTKFTKDILIKGMRDMIKYIEEDINRLETKTNDIHI